MASIETIPGNSAGPHKAPVTKFLLHTTEGTSVEGAVAAYRANNSWPHLTVDARKGRGQRICYHLSYDVAARSLRNLSGGVETNTAGVIQIECVGTATDPNGIDWAWIGANIVGPICRELGIPIVSSVEWVAYPASYGQNARQRLSGSAWLAYQGVLGHEHCPENDHGDPGAIPIQALLNAAAPPPVPVPQEDDDMPYYIRNGQNGAAYRIGVGAPIHQQSISAYQADLKVFKQIDYSAGADCEAHLAAATQEWQCLAALTTISADVADIEAIVGEMMAAGDQAPVSEPDPA